MANFVSNDNATSLMNAINQKKDSKPATITWAEWIALTDEQREGTHYIITNVPAKFSDKDAVFSIKDQTLTFTNKTATVTDSRITTDAYIFTFYHNQAVAQAAGIECSWTTGTVTFTVDENPSEDIVVDILCILPALATPSSEGGGHSIIDSEGNTMPQESAMQFADSHVSDDPTNGKTVIENIKEHTTKADYDNATEDGFHVIDDGNDVPIGEIEEDYEEVIADGDTTYEDLFILLHSKIDASKVTKEAKLVRGTDDLFIFHMGINYLNKTAPNNYADFFSLDATGGRTQDCDIIRLGSSPAYYTLNGGTGVGTNHLTQKPSDGSVWRFYYGTSSTVINLLTDARHCMMSDGQSVEGAINKNEIKSASFSGTTDGSGNAAIATADDKVLISVEILNNNYVYYPFRWGTSVYYAHVMDLSGTPKTGEPVSGIFYYIDK